MKTENKLIQTIAQKQSLSIKQQFNLKILEMNSQEILTFIDEELEKNPLLECDEIFEVSPFKQNDSNFDLYMNYVVNEKTLSETLEEQINVYSKPVFYDIAYFIANSLDSNGYLRIETKEILECFSTYTLDDIEDTISIIQTFEPAGICARNLQECLLIQLCFSEQDYSQLAIMIVNYYLPLIAENKLLLIAKELNTPLDDIKHAVKLIQSLNPKPGASFSKSSQYINPDINIELEDNDIHITLFHTNYGLKLNKPAYNDASLDTKTFLKKSEKNALQLFDSIKKRNSTLMLITQEIVLHQKQYFLSRQALKPLNMKDIANTLSMHESTISRAISNKLLLFENRIIPLKFFFPLTLGQNISSNEILLELENIIKTENKKKPLSDQKIVDKLTANDFQVSRRTIAKYREQLKIPSASKRKEF